MRFSLVSGLPVPLVVSAVLFLRNAHLPYSHAFLMGIHGPGVRYGDIRTRRRNWLGDLWNEVIEFSTYGPGERKLLQERRRQKSSEEDDVSLEAFKKIRSPKSSTPHVKTAPDEVSNEVSVRAFQGAVAKATRDDGPSDDFDGYAFKDILVARWGAPLDVGFERKPSAIYCTVFPVAFGNSKCRHESEIDYLMNLQGVIEILDKYENLGSFIDFLLSTNTTPKPGTSGVQFRLNLTEEQLNSILNRPRNE